MLYTVAGADWSPGLPLTPAETCAGLFRTREAAGRIAPGRPTLAVALRYDATRGLVVAQPPAARDLPGGWTAPAILNGRGGVTVLATVPSALIRLVGRPRIRMHPAHGNGPVGPHRETLGLARIRPGFAGARRSTRPG